MATVDIVFAVSKTSTSEMGVLRSRTPPTVANAFSEKWPREAGRQQIQAASDRLVRNVNDFEARA